MDIMMYTREGRVIKSLERDFEKLPLIAFERSAKIESEKAYIEYGGGAVNTAVTFARMGFRPRVMAAVGTDLEGDKCIRNAIQNGISANLITRFPQVHTGFSVIITLQDGGDRVLFVYRGATRHLQVDTVAAHRVTTPWIYIAPLAGAFAMKNIENLFRQRERRQSFIAWNPSGEQVALGIAKLKNYMKHTKVFMVNEDEAATLLKKTSTSLASVHPRLMASEIRKYGPEITIVTAGHKGAYIAHEKKVFHEPAIISKSLNRTGMGDAFGSGFVSGLILFQNIHTAAKLGTKNAHAVSKKMGAQAGILSKRHLPKLRLTS